LGEGGGRGAPSGGGVTMGADEMDEFIEFCEAEENIGIVRRHTENEIKRNLAMRRRERSLDLRYDFLNHVDSDVQRRLRPLLRHPVLRTIVATFSKTQTMEGFRKWAENPYVHEMLRAACRKLDKGELDPTDLQEKLCRAAALSDETKDVFERASKPVIRLGHADIVQPLNSQVKRRLRGNALYAEGRFGDALKEYEHALGILESVEDGDGHGPESDVSKLLRENKVHCLLNCAAAHMSKELASYGAAVSCCNRVLDLDPGNIKALARRAKAYSLRGDFGHARSDYTAVLSSDPWNFSAGNALRNLKRIESRDRNRQKALFAGFLSPAPAPVPQ